MYKYLFLIQFFSLSAPAWAGGPGQWGTPVPECEIASTDILTVNSRPRFFSKQDAILLFPWMKLPMTEDFRHTIKNLAQILDQTLKAAGYRGSKDGAYKILDMGSGTSEIALSLSTVLADGPIITVGLNSEYVGVDENNNCTQTATRNLSTVPIRTCCINAQAQSLSETLVPGSGFDMVVFRNQNTNRDAKIWQRIFYEGIRRLNPDGVIIMTSLTKQEHAAAMMLIQSINMSKWIKTSTNKDGLTPTFVSRTANAEQEKVAMAMTRLDSLISIGRRIIR